MNAEFTAWLGTVSSSGGTLVRTPTNPTAPSNCGGSTTVSYSISNSCGSSTCSASFTVTNPPAVSLVCPANTTVAACQTQAQVNAEFTAWLATASSSGGCNGSRSNNAGAAPSNCGGTTTVTFTYTSSCAPTTTTCSASFTVSNPPAVSLVCPANTTVAACQTQAQVNAEFTAWLATATSSGGCNGSRSNNAGAAPSNCGGTTTVTFTYTSSCAPTTTTCSASFTVSNPPAVSLVCPQNTTIASGFTQAQVNAAFTAWLATASASGGCNGGLSNNSGAAPSNCGGSATVTFTYTSSCAPATTTCSALFTVPPPPGVSLVCPANTTVAACQTQTAVNDEFTAWLATVSSSGGTLVRTPTNPTAPSNCGGTTTVSYSVTNTCGTNTCSASFTVTNPPAVSLVCPANTTVAACQTQAQVNAEFTAWLATASPVVDVTVHAATMLVQRHPIAVEQQRLRLRIPAVVHQPQQPALPPLQ